MFNIYKITNSVNDCFYYGRTKNSIENRFKDHLKDALKGDGSILHRAIIEIGLDKWKIELVCTCPNFKILKKVESALIKKFNPNLDPEVGYNMRYYTGGIEFCSEETIIKMSISHTGEGNGFYGKFHKIKTRKVMSINHKDFNGIKNPNYGKNWTNEKKTCESKKKKLHFANGGLNGMTGKIRINNGEVNKIIQKDEQIPEGFKKGCLPYKLKNAA